MRLLYDFFDGEALLTGYERCSGDRLEYCISGLSDGGIRIGKKSFRIKEGVCRVEFSELRHGSHIPQLIDRSSAKRLDKISVFEGEVTLCEEAMSRIPTNKMLVSLNERLALAEERLAQITDKVYSKIF